jgi:anti-anti-sigma factor
MSTKLFSTYESQGALVVAANGPIGSLSAAEVRKEAEGLMAEVNALRINTIVFDMDRAEYFGSQVLELMILVWRYLAPAKGSMTVCRLSPAAREMLQVVGLDKLWPVRDTVDEALAGKQPGSDK